MSTMRVSLEVGRLLFLDKMEALLFHVRAGAGRGLDVVSKRFRDPSRHRRRVAHRVISRLDSDTTPCRKPQWGDGPWEFLCVKKGTRGL